MFGEYNCEYKKDGFYSDEDFCHIYWRCNYGVAEEYECPAGTAWNHVESNESMNKSIFLLNFSQTYFQFLSLLLLLFYLLLNFRSMRLVR